MRDRVGEKFGLLTVIKLHEIKKFDCGASVSQWLMSL